MEGSIDITCVYANVLPLRLAPQSSEFPLFRFPSSTPLFIILLLKSPQYTHDDDHHHGDAGKEWEKKRSEVKMHVNLCENPL